MTARALHTDIHVGDDLRLLADGKRIDDSASRGDLTTLGERACLGEL